MIYAAAAALCMAMSWWTWCKPVLCGVRRLTDGTAALAASVCAPSLTLVLELIAVAVRQGTSIARSLEVIGGVIQGDLGRALALAGSALGRGSTWGEAWALTGVDAALDASGQRSVELVRETLEMSWRYGDSPVGRIEAAVAQLDAHQRAEIERYAANLSVRILLPTGLCVLPAFVLIGIVPTIASFVT